MDSVHIAQYTLTSSSTSQVIVDQAFSSGANHLTASCAQALLQSVLLHVCLMHACQMAALWMFWGMHLRHILEEGDPHFDPAKVVQECQHWESGAVKHHQAEGDQSCNRGTQDSGCA